MSRKQSQTQTFWLLFIVLCNSKWLDQICSMVGGNEEKMIHFTFLAIGKLFLFALIYTEL